MHRYHRTRLHGFLAALVLVTAAGLAQPAAARNLLANSSFEIGADHRYAIGRWYMNGLPNTHLDDTTKVHGNVSLRLPFSHKGYNRIERYGIELRGGVGVPVEKGKTYTFSIYLKTDVPDSDATMEISPRPPYEHRGRPVASQKIKLGRKFTPDGFQYPWTRYSITFTAKKSEDVFWVASLESKRKGTLWADAVQFEEGALRDYQPATELEAGLMDRTIGHIHDVGEAPQFDIVVYNDSEKPMRRQARLRVLDENGATVSERALDLKAAPKERRTEKITLDVRKANGYFLAELTMPEVPGGYLQDTTFTVLPKPRAVVPVTSAFGAYITPSEEALRILSRAGFHWTATLTSAEVLANWGYVEHRKGRYAWHDDEIDLFRRYGFEIMMNLEGWAFPRWMEKLSKKERAEAFARYVEEATRHYRGKIRYFNFTDEIHNKIAGSHMLGSRPATWENAKEYAEWHTAAHAAAKRGNPDSQIVVNTAPGDYGPEQLFKYMSPETVDVLALNYYPYPKDVRHFKRAADSAGISTVWAPGVAINTWPALFRKNRPMNRGWGGRLDWMTRTLIQSFAGGASAFFHYTGSYVGNTNVYSIIEHDSSLETGGAQFAALAWLLDGFSRTSAVPVVRTSMVEAYRFDRRDGQAVFALWSKLESPDQNLELKTPATDARVYDRWTNLQPGSGPDGLTNIALGHGTRFVIVPAASADAFQKNLSLARFRVAALPEADKVIRAGRYALLEHDADKNARRDRQFQLWYETEDSGWAEVLSRKLDKGAPAVTLDAEGLMLDFSSNWDGKPVHLKVGQLSSSLFWGKPFWRSMPGWGGVFWEEGRLVDENISGKLMTAKKTSTPPKAHLAPIAYEIEGERGITLAVETMGEQPNPKFPMAGGWDIYAWPTSDTKRWLSLWRYVHGADPRKRDLRVRVRVLPET